jgi:hypothetical protein
MTVEFCHIADMLHTGEMPLSNRDWGFFNFTRPYRLDTVPEGREREHADAVKQASEF